jgi:hypothetical protein
MKMEATQYVLIIKKLATISNETWIYGPIHEAYFSSAQTFSPTSRVFLTLCFGNTSFYNPTIKLNLPNG